MNRVQANLCLLTVSICWSSETILLKNVPSDVSALAIVFLTNLFAALIMGCALFPRLRKMKFTRSMVVNIAILAAMNVAYNVLYTLSLRYLDIPTAVFMRMSTYLIVPIGLLILRRRVRAQTWIGLALVVAGIFVALGSGLGALNALGIGLILGSCTIEACYLIRLNDYAKVVASEQIIAPLLGFVTLFSGIAWVVIAPSTVTTLNLSATSWASLLMDGIFVCCIAVTLNVFAQKVAMVQDAIIIYSLQIVFSILFAALLPDLLVDTVPLSVTSVIGCLLVCLGNIAAEFDWKKLLGRNGAAIPAAAAADEADGAIPSAAEATGSVPSAAEADDSVSSAADEADDAGRDDR